LFAHSSHFLGRFSVNSPREPAELPETISTSSAPEVVLVFLPFISIVESLILLVLENFLTQQ